jgi:hypothetical protein
MPLREFGCRIDSRKLHCCRNTGRSRNGDRCKDGPWCEMLVAMLCWQWYVHLYVSIRVHASRAPKKTRVCSENVTGNRPVRPGRSASLHAPRARRSSRRRSSPSHGDGARTRVRAWPAPTARRVSPSESPRAVRGRWSAAAPGDARVPESRPAGRPARGSASGARGLIHPSRPRARCCDARPPAAGGPARGLAPSHQRVPRPSRGAWSAGTCSPSPDRSRAGPPAGLRPRLGRSARPSRPAGPTSAR